MSGMFGANPVVGRGGTGRLWHARVTSITDGIRVVIPDLASKRHWKVEDWTQLTFTVTHGLEVVTVATAPLAVGAEVLVGFTDPDQPVIIGRKPTS